MARQGIDLSTAGIHLLYAVGAKDIKNPESLTYTDIPGVKSTPSLNPAPDTLETTTLNETEYKTYIPGLKDPGGAIEFTFNLNQELMTAWEGDGSGGKELGVMKKFEQAKENQNTLWFLIYVPGLDNNFYFPGEPSSLGLPETSVNSVLETTVYITPIGEPMRAAHPANIEKIVKGEPIS